MKHLAFVIYERRNKKKKETEEEEEDEEEQEKNTDGLEARGRTWHGKSNCDAPTHTLN